MSAETILPHHRPVRALVAFDGSETAQKGVDLVASVAWPPGTAIVVVVVVETGPDLFGGQWPAVAMIQANRIEEELGSEAELLGREAAERLAGPGRSVDYAVIRGRAATAIVDKARDLHADLLVLGSRGHGTIESMVLGSVTAEVVDHAPCPVVVARGDAATRVVLAWDGSSCARRAAELLWSQPLFLGSVVRVVSVADAQLPWWVGFPVDASGVIGPYADARDAGREHHAELARQMTVELEAAGVRAEPDVRAGDAATEILAVARGWNADMIVIGTHGRTGIARLVMGSVARNVLQHATCSVLVARETHASRD